MFIYVEGTHRSQPLDLSIGKILTFYPHLIPERPGSVGQ